MLTSFADGRVFGEFYGDPPPSLIYLHGWARTHEDFASTARELAATGRSGLALDLPGFGASPAPRVVGGARDYASALWPTIAETIEGPITLVGHSMGGRVALCLAAAHPEQITALVLISTPLLRRASRKSPWRYRALRRAHSLKLVGDSTMERARQRYGSADYRAAHGVIRDVLVRTVNEDYTSEINAWRGPTTLIWGIDDHDVPLEVARAAAQQWGSSCRLVELNGVGHLVPTQAPSAIVAALSSP